LPTDDGDGNDGDGGDGDGDDGDGDDGDGDDGDGDDGDGYDGDGDGVGDGDHGTRSTWISRLATSTLASKLVQTLSLPLA